MKRSENPSRPQRPSRINVNLRVDVEKLEMLERMRTSGWGFSRTEKNRSDVYNEALGFGLQTMILRQEIGEKDFEHLWKLINKVDMRKLNLDQLEKFVG